MSEERNAETLPEDEQELRDDFDEPEVDELDDGEAETGEAPAEEVEPEPQRRRARPGPRERRERAELRELREEQQRLRQELAQTRQSYQPPRQDPYEAHRAEQAWREQVSLLSPDQQFAAYNQRTEQRVAAALQQQEQRIKDQADRTDWNALCRTDTLAAKYRDRVEALCAGMVPGAVPRELIFEKLLGEDMRKQRATSVPRQRREAAERVRQQTAAPAGGRSDGARARADTNDNSIEASRRRIAGKALW